MKNLTEALTFDDVLIVPSKSSVRPSDTDVSTKITQKIKLRIPLISAAMDTVTESKLAIKIAQMGGLGIIHKNLDFNEQALEVNKVKRFESGMVINPVTINPENSLNDALSLKEKNNISGIPVVEKVSKKLVGILTNRDIRFAKNLQQKVSSLMTKDNLITVSENISMDKAQKLLHKHRIEKLLVVDKEFRCVGLITVKDIEKAEKFPLASKDKFGRLLVGAAVGVGEKQGIERTKYLEKAGADVIVIDTAHGHSENVIDTLRKIKEIFPKLPVIVGNIATSEAAKELIKFGADALKIGIGPGSICTTRIIAGVGVPQLHAISETYKVAKKNDIPIISDGGIKYSGDIAKAIAFGADIVMIGSLFAGTDESPGETFLSNGRTYKSYRGMGSIAAMGRGSADRYFQEEIINNEKFVPEGVEGRVPYRGTVVKIIEQLIGGLKASMGYTGNKNLNDFKTKTKILKITAAGLNESHVHGISITRESPNYQLNK
ncbi:MAG: IMP dehydrogenase [Pseudomonadota bacterium]|nr:IMP dehydrogenase [Pseudomonadota bacterium]